MRRFLLLALLALRCTSLRRTPTRLWSSSPAQDNKQDVLAAPIRGVRKMAKGAMRVLSANPISRIFSNTYTFWYWLPKRNMPYDMPWQLFKNSTVEWIAWYQFPHNLPPYGYLPVDRDGEFGGYREDFFCYGLPGNTLPLGNWDPAGFQLVDKKVLLKYRESELKHGRLAMLSAVGFAVQENFHPLYENIGGLAITHMAQLRNLLPSESHILGPLFSLIGLGGDVDLVNFPSLDYICVCAFLALFEVAALRRNWVRWADDGYNHQFDQNIGIGNLRPGYDNGDYGYDPLRLRPSDPALYREVQEMELNHARLAMVAIIGMIGQEYLTGLPIGESLSMWLSSSSSSSQPPSPEEGSSLIETIFTLPNAIEKAMKALQTESLGGTAVPPPPSPP